MFGQMFGFGQQQEEVRRGQDIVVPLLVTLEELYSGTVISVTATEKQVRDAPGFRDCNCRLEMRQQQVAPGQFQMYQEQVRVFFIYVIIFSQFQGLRTMSKYSFDY